MKNDTMRLLLISASTDTSNILHLLGDRKRIALVTFAQCDPRPMLKLTRDFWAPYDRTVTQVCSADDLARAEAIFVCGGNTFLLLKKLYEHSLVEPIRELVRSGIPYAGASAGSNITAPTIKTTNDMPIVAPPTLDALGLVPFQINPHYPDPDSKSTPLGQTREDRLREYLHENEIPVIGLREPSALLVENGKVTLLGDVTARLFRRGAEPVELIPGPIEIGPLPSDF
jgi:dipeptidase E